MEDKRLYERQTINLDSSFFVKMTDGIVEFSGVIHDISEGGIGIHLSEPSTKELADSIDIGSSITFQSYDEYKLYGKMVTDVITSDVIAVRKEIKNDGTLVIGCKIVSLNKGLEYYINNKKISNFIDLRFT